MKVSTFRADTHSINNKTGEYVDPLMKWPLRGAAFTNEVGEALRPLIGNAATICWAPALMYIGADIYDKYKNDKTEYSPNSRRLLEQAIFQGMASIFLPLVAVKAGQNIFSQFGRIGKDKIPINLKERICNTAENFIANGQMHAYHNKESECIEAFRERVYNTIDYFKNEEAEKFFFAKIFHQFEKTFFKKDVENIKRYSDITIKDLIEKRKNLINPTEDFKETQVYKDYTKALSKEQTQNVAIKSALSKFQQRKMLLGRFIKTLGGFIALGLLIKPIDRFVENILIGKVISPKLNREQTIKKENS